MAVNILGLVSIIVFYLIILAIGLWAGWKSKQKNGTGTDSIMLAGRDIGTFVGILTMTATWVGGGFINGSAEESFTSGIVWCQAPFGYSLSLLLGGLLFAKPMREKGYVTMIDPFQEKYGARIGGILFLPALLGEVLWSSAILAALGSTLAIILQLDNTISVIISAAIAVLYTLFGGLYSVAYTDVVQLFCIALGLVICIPFAWQHPAVNHDILSKDQWWGTIDTNAIGVFIDYYLLLIFGGIPWQVYFQRVLASKTARKAQYVSYIAGFGCILLAIPPVTIGIIARATDWENATNYRINNTQVPAKMILPLALQYLTPEWVSFIGLGAVSAAVMSSADSSVLSASSMFARNIYKAIIVPSASEKHIVYVTWIAIIVVASVATAIALSTDSIYGLFLLCSDLVYVLLFPQLLLIIYWADYTNTYGCLTGLVLGLIFRVLGGEPTIELSAILLYPMHSNGIQQFPFRTLSMLIALVSQILVSLLFRFLFRNHYLPSKCDIFQCFPKIPPTFQEQRTDLQSSLKPLSIPRPRFNHQKLLIEKGSLTTNSSNGEINHGFVN